MSTAQVALDDMMRDGYWCTSTLHLFFAGNPHVVVKLKNLEGMASRWKRTKEPVRKTELLHALIVLLSHTSVKQLVLPRADMTSKKALANLLAELQDERIPVLAALFQSKHSILTEYQLIASIAAFLPSELKRYPVYYCSAQLKTGNRCNARVKNINQSCKRHTH